MSEMMCCPLSGSDGDNYPKFYNVKLVRARKPHKCGECGEPMVIGTRHERVNAKWDQRVDTMRTCLLCVEIRDHFACGNGFIFGQLWEDLEENFFPEMKAGGPCMDGLSPEAKDRLFTFRTAWLFDSTDPGCGPDGARPPHP